MADLLQLFVPLPPLPEQRRISAILTEQLAAVDRARAAVRAQLAAAEALPAAYLRTVFESDGAKRWPRRRLGEVCEVVTGTTPPRSNAGYFGGSTPWVKPDDLDKGVYVRQSAEYLSAAGTQAARVLPSGAVLVSCIGKLGKTAIAACDLASNQQINALVPGAGVEYIYLYWFCRTLRPTLEALASSTIVPIVNKSTLADITIPVPPLPEQRRIAVELTERMAGVDRLSAALDDEAATLDRVPSAILSHAFEGGL